VAFAFLMMIAAGGCSSPPIHSLSRGGTTIVIDASQSRVRLFNRDGRANALTLTADSDRPLPQERQSQADFPRRGGVYTWLAPQSQWIDPVTGHPRRWPPELAMDAGPTQVLAVDSRHLKLLGPPLASNVRQQVEWALHDDGSLQLAVCLLPAGEPAKPWSPWVITGVRSDTVVAVRAGSVHFKDSAYEVIWHRAVTERDGWLLVNLRDIAIKGKVFLNSQPIIAAWRDGQWLVRVGQESSAVRHADDAPVELYFDPANDYFELEFVGPYRPVTSDGANQWIEQWHIVPTATPELRAIDRFVTR